MEESNKIPVHVSIIMDGNGRWAKQRGKERVYGHMHGVESVRACVTAASKNGVRYLSLYAFSEENWGRPIEEVTYLMEILVTSMLKEVDELDKQGVRLLVRGNRARLSDKANEIIDKCEKQTEHNDLLTLILMISYSGKWDIMQAASALAADVASGKRSMEFPLTEDDFRSYLVTADIPDPDVIVRTSGEQRLSNYFLWQGAYSEFVFTDILWPDFHEEEFNAVLKEYSKRDRRYGKVK